MQQTIHEECTELTAFFSEHFSVRLHNAFSWEAFCCIHHAHRKHEQGQLLLGLLLYRFSEVVQISPFFASVLLEIELNILKLRSIRNNSFVTKNQKPNSIFAIFLYLKQ